MKQAETDGKELDVPSDAVCALSTHAATHTLHCAATTWLTITKYFYLVQNVTNMGARCCET